MKCKLWQFGVISLFVVIAFSFSSTFCQAEDTTPIKIGGLFDLTGPMTPVGVSNRQGAVLAFEQANFKINGQPVEFIIEDSATNPTIALDKARKLVEVDKVAAIIGPALDPSVVGVAGYMNRVGVPHFVCVPNSVDTVEKNKWSWMMVAPSSTFTYFMGNWAAKNTDLKKWTAIALDLEVGHQNIEGINKGMVEAKNGASIIQEQYFPFETQDFSPYFLRIEKSAQGLCIWAPDIFTQPLFNQLTEFGNKLPVLIVEGGGITADVEGLMQKIGPLIQGMKLGQFWSPFFKDNPLNVKYIEDFKKRWNRVPDWGTAGSYTAAQVIIDALKRNGNDTAPEAFAKAINSTSIDTIRGHISFHDHIAVHDAWLTEIVKEGDTYVERAVKKYNIDVTNNNGAFMVNLKEN